MGASLYRWLARLTPEAFRAEYGDEMCRVAELQWQERRATTGAFGAAWFWTKQSMALVRAAAGLRREESSNYGGMTMDGFGHDLVQALRGLRRRPGFSLLTVLTLGLGIGATTAIFSAVHTVILRPLPYADSDDIAVLVRSNTATGERSEGVGAANIRDLDEQSTLFQQVAVAEPWSLDLQVAERVESLRTWSVSRGFFDAIGAEAQLGRTFVDADYDEADGQGLVVMSHRSWVNRFASDDRIVGSAITMDGQAYTVLGVMPPEFRFPDAAEMWIPRTPQPWDEGARAADFMTGVARLRDGATLAQADAELNQIAQSLANIYPEANADLGYVTTPLREYLFGSVRAPLFVLLVAVGFVLLIACANVAGLMLARGAQRERDYALRGALGAGTGRLMGHVAAESLILAAAGCVLGVVITFGGVEIISRLGPTHLPRIEQLSVDGTVLTFAVVAAALSAVLSSLAPSWKLSRPNLKEALGDGSRGMSASRRQGRARMRLVVTQVAGAVVLLAGAGLLMRSFTVLLDKELGFDPDDRLALQVFAYDFETPDAQRAALEQMLENMRAIPGVTGAGITTDIPGANDGTIAKIDITLPFVIQDRDPPPLGQEPTAYWSQVSPDYFDVMDIDIVAGRAFETADNADGAPIALINETLARRQWGSDDPIGQRMVVQYTAEAPAVEIVGVVADTRPLGHASEPRPEIYMPLAQVGSGSITFVLSTTGDAAALTMPAMGAIWQAVPSQSVYGASTVEGLVSEWLKERQFNLLLLGSFSVIALFLSAIGLYGLISFSVTRRVGELGIRRALGGQSRDLVRMVLGEGARLAGTGLAIGLVASVILSRFIQGMLFEVAPTDPLTFGGLGVLVFAIAAIATLAPALRAMRVNPVEALRSE